VERLVNIESEFIEGTFLSRSAKT